jgi:DNA invertase Pin-like site-specific DNA recombinase
MSNQRRIGISYTRFSDPSQATGDSEGRQARDFKTFCNLHNLTPLVETWNDRGRSGYHDEHRKKGDLGRLIAAAKDGRFEPGTVIVVEAWDRLGRLRPGRQTDLIAELLHTGVDIGICKLNDVFTLDDCGSHKWIVLQVFVQLAYQESKQKADRIAESYGTRRLLAREGKEMPPRKRDGRKTKLITNRLPFWLHVVNGEPVPIPERVAALKRIFRLSADGFGRARIIRTLVKEGIPPFGTEKWTLPYVSKILCDRRVLGEYQPRHTDDTPAGPPVVGYYPGVIKEQEYQLARAGQEGRRGRGGKRDRKHVNVFQSMIVNARDGEGFFLHNRGTEAEPKLILTSAAGMSGRGRTSTFPYLPFEEGVLSLLKEVDSREVLPGEKEAPSMVDVLRAKLANVRHDIAGLQQELKAGYSKGLAAVLREKEAEEEKIASQLQEELAKSAKPAERAWKELPNLAALVKKGGDEARLRLRGVLRRVIESIYLLHVRRGSFLFAAVQVFFRDSDARRDYLIAYQAAGFNRPGGWWAKSLADVVKPGGLDLRRRDHAAKLEKALSAAL